MIGKRSEDRRLDKAVDRIQIKQAVAVQVAELGRPRPAGGIHAALTGRVLIAGHAGVDLKNVAHDLRIVGFVGCDHAGHHRSPGGHRRRAVVVGHHVAGKKLRHAVVVDVARVQTHGAVAGGIETRLLPTVIAAQPQIIWYVEVVANHKIRPAVAVGIEKLDGHCLGRACQWHCAEVAMVVLVDENPAGLVQQKAVAQVAQQTRVVGAGHQIEVAIVVEVCPRHGIGRMGDTGHGFAHEAVGFSSRAGVVPVCHAAGPPGEDDVQPAVAIHVHQVDGARVAVSHALHMEIELAFVPQDAVYAGVVAKDDVEITVVVQIAHAQASTVGLELVNGRTGHGGNMLQLVCGEGVAAWRGRAVQRSGCDAYWRGALRMRGHHATSEDQQADEAFNQRESRGADHGRTLSYSIRATLQGSSDLRVAFSRAKMQRFSRGCPTMLR